MSDLESQANQSYVDRDRLRKMERVVKRMRSEMMIMAVILAFCFVYTLKANVIGTGSLYADAVMADRVDAQSLKIRAEDGSLTANVSSEGAHVLSPDGSLALRVDDTFLRLLLVNKTELTFSVEEGDLYVSLTDSEGNTKRVNLTSGDRER